MDRNDPPLQALHAREQMGLVPEYHDVESMIVIPRPKVDESRSATTIRHLSHYVFNSRLGHDIGYGLVLAS